MSSAERKKLAHVNFSFARALILRCVAVLFLFTCTYRFGIAVTILCAFIIVLSVFGITSLRNYNIPITFSKSRWSEAVYLRHCSGVAVALANKDVTTFGTVERMQQMLWNLTTEYRTSRQKFA